MTDMVRAWLDRVDTLDKNATAGPWEAEFTAPTMGGATWNLRTKDKPGIRMTVNEYQHGTGNSEWIAYTRTAFPQATAAIRAVLDLHKVRQNTVSALYPIPLCDCDKEWPCETVQAIIATTLEDKEDNDND